MEAVGILMMLLHASRFAEMLGMGMSQARMLLHASRFAEMLGMGISQAGMLLHASRFAEMLDMGMSQAGMLHERGRDSREQQFWQYLRQRQTGQMQCERIERGKWVFS